MSDIPKKNNPQTAPTPQNTPMNNAPISSHAQQPLVGTIKEEEFDRAAASIFERNPKLVQMIQGSLALLKRAKIVNGEVEPTEEEIKSGEEEDEEHDAEQAEKSDETAEKIAGIPEFWLSAMKNQVSLAEMITDRDEAALKDLTDIQMEYLDKPGFHITKTYFYQNESGYGGDFIYDHAEGDKINWKDGKDLTVRVESKKQRNKNTKQTRVVKKTVPTESFFNFFSPPKAPTDDDDDDLASDIEERLELDYQLGEDIKEKLIPRAIDWFTGEALQFEELDDDMEEGDFEDEDDEEDLSEDRDDDEDESDDDDDAAKPKQEAAECKQS
ncbi:hypothetical protein DID88_000798 [Monilinia fructigena]|uniref:Nucleosome assembly protein n=1 Tax=Monilinia fructigena TaxID=38457 RepID=A0A395IJW5_9HELO|nr:hypothetical protein DID88_000798 [Monilinia fructigena]